MPTVILSATKINAVERKQGMTPLFLWDATTKGFGVRITASQVAFVVQHRTRDGKTHRQKLGDYPHLSVEEARCSAQDHVRPYSESRADTMDKQTLCSLLVTFTKEYVEKQLKPKTVTSISSSFRRDVTPKLGDIPLSSLTRASIIKWHGEIAKPIAANRALDYLSMACSYAVDREWLTHNPCIGIKRNREKPHDRFLTDTELTAVFSELKSIHKATYECCVILALTGMRRGEVLGRMDYDKSRKVIWLSDSKTGAKSVALNDYANTAVNNYCVDGWTKPSYFQLGYYFGLACSAVKVSGVTPHSLRHTLATYMAQHGDSTFQIAAMGGWKSLDMVQRYVSLHGIGTPHPIPAAERIAKAIGLSG